MSSPAEDAKVAYERCESVAANLRDPVAQADFLSLLATLLRGDVATMAGARRWTRG